MRADHGPPNVGHGVIPALFEAALGWQAADLSSNVAACRLRVSPGGQVLVTRRQPNLPSGWQGGDRLAVCATAVPSRMGRAVTADAHQSASAAC